jgi:hypothetical protein
MAEVKSSPLGNKRMRTLTVGDPTDYTAESLNASKLIAEQNALQNQEVMPNVERNVVQPMAQQRKTRLETLLGLRTQQKEILINDVPIVIRTLFTYEQKDMDKYSGIDLALQIISRVVLSINGEPLENVVNSNKIEDKVEFFKESHFILVDSIFSQYLKFAKEITESYNKSPDFAKEIVEDIKKA